MARLLPSNPLRYLFHRQYDDRLYINKQDELIRERLNFARNLYKKDLVSHYGCVNAIEFSNKGEFLASGGDDRRVLIWNLELAIHGAGEPIVMQTQHMSNIFCLGFDSTLTKVFSGGNDDQVMVHDLQRGIALDNFLHEQPVYGISIDPLNDNVFASACDDGRILIYDIREPPATEPFCLAQYSAAFHAVMFNPVEPRIVATANSKEGVGLWDIRRPKKIVVQFGGQHSFQSCMSVRFNSAGTKILALRRRLPPVIYAPDSPDHVCQFDHAGYYNSCTMKSCSFAGDQDQYVLSGSDNFNLYMWKMPESDEKGQWIRSAHMVLEGHRSIVNQVRFNPTKGIIASSGVEKLIKLWSPFKMPHSSGSLYKGLEERCDERKVYSHEEYISLVMHSGEFMSHDYTSRSTQEDPRMMAFFDSLVQREIEGWTSEDGSSDDSAAPRSPGTPFSFSRGTQQQALAEAFVDAFVEAPPVEPEPNRISQLIARKRAQLMRLAQQPRTAPSADTSPLLAGFDQAGNSGSQNGAVDKPATNGSRKRRKVNYSSDSSDSGDSNWATTTKVQKFCGKYEIGFTSSSGSDSDEKHHTRSSSSDDNQVNGRGDVLVGGRVQDSSSESSDGQSAKSVRKSYSKRSPSSSIRKKTSKCVSKTVATTPSSSSDRSETEKASGSFSKLTNGDGLTELRDSDDSLVENKSYPSKEFCDSSTSSDEDYDERYHSTPNSKIRNGANSTPDSGIAMGPCSSRSFVCTNEVQRNLFSFDKPNTNGTDKDEKTTESSCDVDWQSFKRFNFPGERRNYRKHINDSDSN